MNDALILLNPPACGPGGAPDSTEIRVRAVSMLGYADLLPALMNAIDLASGWVLQRRMISASILQVLFETQARALMDLYGCLMQQGLMLSRDSHLLLAQCCSSARLHPLSRCTIVTFRLEVTLPAELHNTGHWWPELVV